MLLESWQLEERPQFSRWEAWSCEDEAYDLEDQYDEADGPDGPGKANGGKKSLDHGRVDEATSSGTRGGGSHCQGSALAKVCRQESHKGAKDEADAKTLTEALGEEELPVLRAERGHKHANELQDAADYVDVPKVASVRGTAGEGTDEEEEPDLHGADPGDVRGRAL